MRAALNDQEIRAKDRINPEKLFEEKRMLFAHCASENKEKV